jgi:hypothetical protein
VLDIGGHVTRPHRDDARVLEQQLPVVRAHLRRVEPEPIEQVERVVEEVPARDRDREWG